MSVEESPHEKAFKEWWRDGHSYLDEDQAYDIYKEFIEIIGRYPTEHAYLSVCKARDKWQKRAEKLEEALKEAVTYVERNGFGYNQVEILDKAKEALNEKPK